MKMERREVLGVLTAAAGSALLPVSLTAGQAAPAQSQLPQERVTGIGGVFFRARDPKALAEWYQAHLGVFVVPRSKSDPVWNQQAGPTAFQPFPETSSYFGDATKQWMLNFRVEGLNALKAALETKGIEVITNPEWDAPGVGRFARIRDPEGNAIELWEPD